MLTEKKKVLYISMMAPYDSVDHAGGKVHNFYLKYMHRSGRFDITLLSMCWKREEDKLDLDRYGIKNDIYVLDKNKIHRLIRKGISGFSYFNPFDKYGSLFLDYERHQYKRLISRHYRKVKEKQEEKPDIIILQWTQMIFLIDFVKKLFPNTKVIAIEEDVSYLNYYRMIGLSKTILNKSISKYRYRNVKKLELKALKKADVIVNNNHKDFILLQNDGIESAKLRELPIYFQSYESVDRKKQTRDILFYGAMARPENYKSALWFIENVMPLLSEENVRFVVVGSRPDNALLDKQSENVIVTGFVESVAPFFERSLCLVAPLVLGAGVKVKILEAMSSGIPVLTNDIGIEGIPAQDGLHFHLCIKPDDYARVIKKIIADGQTVNLEAKKFVKESYDLPKALQKLIDADMCK